MSAFTAEAVMVSPAIGILSYFKDATSAGKSPTIEAIPGPQNAVAEENNFRAVADQLATSISVDMDVTHHLLSIIEENSRVVAWKYFLKVPTGCDDYVVSCQIEQKPFDRKIRDDSFRTFKGDHEFWSRVNEDALVRVLNALSSEFGYVQGMNVLLGPFMYTMTEQESFYCLRTLLRSHIPRYVLKNLDGAQDGAKLFAKCLRIVDSKLYTHIITKIPDLSIFSLKYVLTLFANAKPLSEVLKLWDATFAIGPHFNIMLLCAKLMLLRDAILKEKRGAKILILLEEAPVVSSVLIDGALCLMKYIPHELMRDLRTHPLLSSTSASSSAATQIESPMSVSGQKFFASDSTACTSGNTSGSNSHNSSSNSIDLHGLHSHAHSSTFTTMSTPGSGHHHLAHSLGHSGNQDHGQGQGLGQGRHPGSPTEALDFSCLKMSSTSTEKSVKTERSERSVDTTEEEGEGAWLVEAGSAARFADLKG